MKTKVEKVHDELYLLEGALRCVGDSLVTISHDEDRDTPCNEMEDFGWLICTLGRYAERLANDLDSALAQRNRHQRNQAEVR